MLPKSAALGWLWLAGVMACSGVLAETAAEPTSFRENAETLSSRSLLVFDAILSPTANLAEQLSRLPPPAAGNTENGYTVQLGAFPSKEAMHDYADSHGLRELDNLLGHRIEGKQHAWYVITWEEFSGREQAETAWRAQKQNFPGVEHWVRSISSLEQAKSGSK